MSGACDKPCDDSSKAPRPRNRGLQRPPTTTLPTCYHRSRYPPGCTVLECRLEADRPVARVVQVPVATATTARNSCLPAETSPVEPRVMSRRLGYAERRVASVEARDQIADKVVLSEARDLLESQECADTSVRINEISINAGPVALPEIGSDEEQFEDPKTYRSSTSCDRPTMLIECVATPEGPSAKITQRSTSESIQLSCVKKSASRLETSVRFGDKYPVDTRCSPARYPSDQCESRARMISRDDKIAEKPIDPAATAIPARRTRQTIPRCSSATYRKPKSGAIECARQSDPEIVISFSPRTQVTPVLRAARRNGLNPAEFLPESAEKSRSGGRVGSQPTDGPAIQRSAAEEIRESSFSTEARVATHFRPDDQPGRLRRPASEQMLGAEVARLESAKSDKASACRRSATNSGRGVRLIPQRVSEDTSQEPLTLRRDVHIPEYQLERYEACRSKRNGLQDECITPFLRAMSSKTQLKRTLRKSECGRNIDQLDQGGTRESTCAHRDQGPRIVFCLG